MGTRQVGLADIRQGGPPSRLRLLAPLRYLTIYHEEKTKYDFLVPTVIALVAWGIYMVMSPRIPLFGEGGLLRFTRDLLVMAVPFMIGALASVAMGAPGGDRLDRRPPGAELYLGGSALTLRQFVCYLLGYLSFLGLITLGSAVLASLLKDFVIETTKGREIIRACIHGGGTLILSFLLSSLAVTVFWALYFLTDILNRPDR